MYRFAALLGFALIFLPAPVHADSECAQSSDASLAETPTSLYELETLRSGGYQGPVDLSRMRRGERCATQAHEFRFDNRNESSAPAAADENWWNGFSGTGIEEYVTCAVMFQGKLIIGGYFQNAGGIPGTEAISGWDGNQWFSLNADFVIPVVALIVYNGELYAGGGFLWAGGAVANFLARWDGTTWNSVGTEPNHAVWSLRVANGLLYVGGDFTSIGGISASRIAIWNGSSWSAMGPGANGSVLAITDYRGEIVMGGNFTQSGATVLNQIGRWNGTSWQPLGTGTSPDVVNTLVTRDTLLYAGGYFIQAGGVAVNHVACWNGTEWSALGSGVGNEVVSLAFVGNDLWAGGFFTTAGGISARALARWNGNAWCPFGTGLAGEFSNGVVQGIYSAGDSVYVGGVFRNADGVEAINLALWSQSQGSWLPMSSTGNGTLDTGWAVAEYQGDLFVGGSFTRAGGQPIRCLARWDGTTWHDCGNTGQAIGSFALYDGKLITCGNITSLGGVPIPYIAQWDGVSWQPVGTGMNGPVGGLSVINGDLYAVGAFTMAGGVPANRVARWDGTSWHALGAGITGGTSPYVFTIREHDGLIYVGGRFATAGSVQAKNVARWDGVNWYNVGGGVQGFNGQGQPYTAVVYDFEEFNGQLIVGGDFTQAGSLPVVCIAAWDGANWSTVGVGSGGRVFAMAVYGSYLVAGGYCRPGGGSGPLHYIARWDGASWSSMGSGMNDLVHGMSVIGGSLYVVGAFQSAGGKSSFGIAKWTDPAVSAVSITPQIPVLTASPNPFRRWTSLTCKLTHPGSYELGVYDVMGRRVRTLANRFMESGAGSFSWDGRSDAGVEVGPGAYFMRLMGDIDSEPIKVIRLP